jgi:hypothetical protein
MRVLISQSSDGEFIAQAMEKLGFLSIRGSSKKRSDPSQEQERRGRLSRNDRLGEEDGGAVAITPDGPRGPAEVMQPGVAALARMTGVAGASGRHRLPSPACGSAPGTAPWCPCPSPRRHGLGRAAPRQPRRRPRSPGRRLDRAPPAVTRAPKPWSPIDRTAGGGIKGAWRTTITATLTILDMGMGTTMAIHHGHSHGHHHGHGHMGTAPANFDRAFAVGAGLNLAFVPPRPPPASSPIRWPCWPTPATTCRTCSACCWPGARR